MGMGNCKIEILGLTQKEISSQPGDRTYYQDFAKKPGSRVRYNVRNKFLQSNWSWSMENTTSAHQARPKGEITIVSAMPGQRKRKKTNLDSLVVSRISLTHKSPMHMHIHPPSRCQTRSRCVDKNILRSDPSVRFWYTYILDFWVRLCVNKKQRLLLLLLRGSASGSQATVFQAKCGKKRGKGAFTFQPHK